MRSKKPLNWSIRQRCPTYEHNSSQMHVAIKYHSNMQRKSLNKLIRPLHVSQRFNEATILNELNYISQLFYIKNSFFTQNVSLN
jgi:hypothetical protein